MWNNLDDSIDWNNLDDSIDWDYLESFINWDELEFFIGQLEDLEDKKSVYFFIKPISEALVLNAMIVPNLNECVDNECADYEQLFIFHAQVLQESISERLKKKEQFPSDDELSLYWIKLPVELAFNLFNSILDLYKNPESFHEDIKISLLSCVLDPVFFDYIKALSEEKQWNLFYKALPIIAYLSPLYLLPGVRNYLIQLQDNKREEYLEKISDLLIKSLYSTPELHIRRNLRQAQISFLCCLISLVADVNSVDYFIKKIKEKYNQVDLDLKLKELNKRLKPSDRKSARERLNTREKRQKKFITNLLSYQEYIQEAHSNFNLDQVRIHPGLFLIYLRETQKRRDLQLKSGACSPDSEGDLKKILEDIKLEDIKISKNKNKSKDKDKATLIRNKIRFITTIISYPEKAEEEVLTKDNYHVLFSNFGTYFNQCMGPLLAMTWFRNSNIKNNPDFLTQLINTTRKHNVPDNFLKFLVFSYCRTQEILEDIFIRFERKESCHHAQLMNQYLTNSLNILTPESFCPNFFNQTTDLQAHNNQDSPMKSFQITHSI